MREVPKEWWELACKKIPHPLACVSRRGEFVWVNDAFCRLTGFSTSELYEKRWSDITVSADVGGDLRSVDEIIAGEIDEYYLEKQYIRRGGDIINVGLFVHRFPQAGDFLCFIASVDDITKDETIRRMNCRVAEIEQRLNDLIEARAVTFRLMPWLLKYWPVVAGLVAAIGSFVAWLVGLMSEGK